MSKLNLFPSLPASLVAAARRLGRRSGVLGVFAGRGRRRGKWGRELCLVVHVARKVHPLNLGKQRQLPTKLGRYRVDVIEVGCPRAHALDVSDELLSPGIPPRTGTLTALLDAAHGGLALISGHVGLPFENGVIVDSYDSHHDPAQSISAVDAMSQQRLSGSLVRGGISSRADWTLVRFSNAGSVGLEPIHPLVNAVWIADEPTSDRAI